MLEEIKSWLTYRQKKRVVKLLWEADEQLMHINASYADISNQYKNELDSIMTQIELLIIKIEGNNEKEELY